MSESGQQKFIGVPDEESQAIFQRFFPIDCPRKSSAIWKEVQEKMFSLYRSLLTEYEEKGLEVENIEENIPRVLPNSEHDLYGHVAYILKIVDKVLESVGADDQIDTIFFIDKSGRIVAYLFKAMWNDLRKMGLIDNSIQCPRIRFVNDGCDSGGQKNKTARAEAADYIKQAANKGGILVVDEIISSGTTIKSVLRVFEHANVKTFGGLSAYPFTPLWYFANKGQKGVREVSINSITYEVLDKLPLEDFQFLRKIVYLLIESGVFTEVMTLLIQIHPDRVEKVNNMLCQKSISLSAEEIRRMAKIISEIKFELMDAALSRAERLSYAVEQLFLYFKYHAGYLVQPLKLAKERRTGYLYRRVLREMVKQSTKHFYQTQEKEDQVSPDNDGFTEDSEREMMIQTGGKLARLLKRIQNIFS